MRLHGLSDWDLHKMTTISQIRLDNIITKSWLHLQTYMHVPITTNMNLLIYRDNT